MELLEALTTTAGIPGREHRVRRLITDRVAGLFDSLTTDPMGSLIGVRKPRPGSGSAGEKPLKVMIAAHMDQIGFMTRHIDDHGFMRLNAVGGFDTRNLFARLVTVCPDPLDASKDLPGVLNPGGRPIHIATEEDKKKIPEMREFVVDLGMTAEQVRQRVKIGDMVVLKAPFEQVGEMVVSQCLDNRVACWIAIRAIEKLEHHDCEIHCVFTVQEEVGLRGATTSAYTVQPDIGIALDTTLCVDTPGVPEEERVTRHGGGAGLTAMDSSFISDYGLLQRFEALAEQHGIAHQRSILPRGGTDSGAMQRAGSGARVFTLSCPTRYIHTVTEAVNKHDLFACRDLLAAFLEAGV